MGAFVNNKGKKPAPGGDSVDVLSKGNAVGDKADSAIDNIVVSKDMNSERNVAWEMINNTKKKKGERIETWEMPYATRQ